MHKLFEPLTVGEKIHYFTVVERLYDRNGHIYNVQCVCGKIKTYNYSTLARIADTVKSCGCMSKELIGKGNRLPNKQGKINAKYTSYINNAKFRNHVFELSLLEFTHLILSKCWYCGKLEDFNGIDRVDNKLGYIDSNCVSCCKRCNYMKRDATLEDFLDTAKRITEYQKARELLGDN